MVVTKRKKDDIFKKILMNLKICLLKKHEIQLKRNFKV